MAEGFFDKKQESAPFNMAIATLQRLSLILEKITDATSNPSFNSETKQYAKLGLVRSFFFNAVPLLKTEFVDKYREEIINMKMKRVEVFNQSSKPIAQRVVFDEELDRRLDQILIETQLKLQEEGYFMPPKNDPRFSWKQ